jgi:alpha-galactosidase
MITAHIRYDNKTLQCHLNKSTVADDLYVFFTQEDTPQYSRLKLDIHPKQDIVLHNVDIQIQTYLDKNNTCVLCNGFQTWSETREYTFDETPDNLRWFAKPLLGYSGDYHIPNIPRQKGILHSWTYAYHRANNDDAINFIGSLNETTGFTYFLYNSDNQTITIKKEIGNLKLTHSFPTLDIVMLKGDTPSVFKQYFDLQNLPKPKFGYTTGWTSWYNYYNKISEDIIVQNLQAFKEKELPIDIFQIDDGWQTRIGDWLSIQPSFPKGMAHTAQLIHNQGFKAGLWLAPFIAEAKSHIFLEKKDWLLKDAKGNTVAVGYAPHWSGKFYALDFYNKDVQDYLAGVFHTVLHKCGFDMVKLDFLYAVCVLPRPNKTRGQIMHEAMTFLRQLTGDKILLACGVPLGSTFGLADFCRIGADIHLTWEHRFLKFLRHRERVSTIVALRSVLNRWQLNGNAFLNDPDVFILREKNHNLTPHQQETILIINVLLGDLLFCSDFVGEYTEGVLAQYKMIFDYENRVVKNVSQPIFDFYVIDFELNGEAKKAYCNLNNRVVKFEKQALQAFQTVIVW